MTMRNLCDCLYINYISIGIAGSFYEEQFGLRPDGFLEIRQVGRIHEGRGHPVLDKRMAEKVIGSSVNCLGGDDMVSGPGDIEDGICDRRRT